MKKNNSTTIIFSLVLTMILLVSTFLILTYQTNSFSNITKEIETANDVHIPYAYLANRLRNGKDIDVHENALKVSDDVSDTYIYFYEDCLCELTVLKGYEPDFRAGEKLFEMDKFSVILENEMIKINYAVDGMTRNLSFGVNHE